MSAPDSRRHTSTTTARVSRLITAIGFLAMCTLLTEVAVGTESVTLGPVTATVDVSPREPVIGDILTLSIEVVAAAKVEILMPEFGEALDRFAIVDFVPRQQIDADGNTISSQEYRLQPSFSGPQSIPPILIEFVDRRQGQRLAPEGQDAYELLTPRLDFEVQSVIPSSADNRLKPPLGQLAIQQPVRQGSAILMLAATGLVLFIAGGAYWWRWPRKPPEVSAYEIAHRRLTALRARPLPSSEQLDPFFVELSDIVRTYLERRFNLRAPELTTEEFLDVASTSPDLSQQHQHQLRTFLQQADLVKFAGYQPSEEDIQAALDAAEHFLEETRETTAAVVATP